MVSFNRTILAGNLTRDPELRFTKNGVAVCDFGIAVNQVRSRQEDTVDYFNVTAWRELAETIANYKRKGDPVLVEGRLEYSQWEDKQTGDKRSAVKIVAEKVQFLPSGNDGSANGTSHRSGASSAGGTRQAAAHGRARNEDPDDEDFDDIPFAMPRNLKSPVF